MVCKPPRSTAGRAVPRTPLLALVESHKRVGRTPARSTRRGSCVTDNLWRRPRFYARDGTGSDRANQIASCYSDPRCSARLGEVSHTRMLTPGHARSARLLIALSGCGRARLAHAERRAFAVARYAAWPCRLGRGPMAGLGGRRAPAGTARV